MPAILFLQLDEMIVLIVEGFAQLSIIFLPESELIQTIGLKSHIQSLL